MTKVLFVCLGNICRSPAAEAVFRAKATAAGLDVTVDSAGTSDWHIGNPPYPPAIAEGQSRGYDLTSLRARQATAKDFDQFDLIIGMDGSNIERMEAIRPANNATPLRRMTDFASALPADVPDPYYTGDYGEAFDLIEAASDALLAHLQSDQR